MALNIFSRLMPPEESFTALFCQQAERIAEAARELRALIAAADAGTAHVSAIRAIEIAADAVAKKVFIAANRTFNAPIDREDLLALAHDLDDAVDLIEDTAKGIARYGVTTFPPQMHAMADAVLESGLLALRLDLREGRVDTIGYIDRKELYELIESVVDKCDDVANAV